VHRAQGLAKKLRRPVLVDDSVMCCELDESVTLGTCRDESDSVYITVKVTMEGVGAKEVSRIRNAVSEALYKSAYLFSQQRGE
jgi:hypothetical protein